MSWYFGLSMGPGIAMRRCRFMILASIIALVPRSKSPPIAMSTCSSNLLAVVAGMGVSAGVSVVVAVVSL
jgi:hypothetical protein